MTNLSDFYSNTEIISKDFKNKIINGNFDIWQRGTSFAAAASGTFPVDRFAYYKSGTMVHTLVRSEGIPPVAESGKMTKYSLRLDCTTADVAVAAGDYCVLRYKIEGYDAQALMGNTITVSFWVNATKTGTYCIALNSSIFDYSYIVEYTVNSSDTWEKKEITLTMANGSIGTWDYTNGIGLAIDWILTAGSTFHGTADIWQTGPYLATSNQVNACDNTLNNFDLSQVQLEVGSKATPFESRSFEQELALCQRYYERFTSAAYTVFSAGLCNSATSFLCYLRYISKRTTPTFNDSGTFEVKKPGGAEDITGLSATHISYQHCSVEATVAAGLTAGNAGLWRAKNDTSAYVELDAEL